MNALETIAAIGLVIFFIAFIAFAIHIVRQKEKDAKDTLIEWNKKRDKHKNKP